MSEHVLLDNFVNVLSDGTVEILDNQRNVRVRLYSHPSNDVEGENKKLREYAKQMCEHITESCGVCDEYYCSSWDEDNECCVFVSYMRELGIEVRHG